MNQIMESFEMVLHSNTIEELKDRLENCVSSIRREYGLDAPWEMEKMHMRLKEAIRWPIGNNPYYIVDGSNGLLLYLYLFWFDSVEYLKGVAKQLDVFVAPRAEKISVDNIHTLYSLVESKFSYTTNVVAEKPLYIISLDYSHITFNSAYLYQKREKEIFDAILLTHPQRDFFCSQQHSFLHELGHLIHSRLLHDAHQFPVSFNKIIERMFTGCLESPSEDNVEIFCDCFSIAAAHQTEWEKSSPWASFREKDKRQLYFYMKMLIETYDKNPMGQLSYDELVTTYVKANHSIKR